MGKNTLLEIDFYKEFELPTPTCGLVSKITSPKGIRKLNENDRYEYHLKDELIQIYDGKPASVPAGIYWVMDIYKDREHTMRWNHYLIVVEEDSFYAVAEFLNCEDSTWIRQALPYIKDYFEEFELEPIEITPYKPPKQSKKGWKTAY